MRFLGQIKQSDIIILRNQITDGHFEGSPTFFVVLFPLNTIFVIIFQTLILHVILVRNIDHYLVFVLLNLVYLLQSLLVLLMSVYYSLAVCSEMGGLISYLSGGLGLDGRPLDSLLCLGVNASDYIVNILEGLFLILINV